MRTSLAFIALMFSVVTAQSQTNVIGTNDVLAVIGTNIVTRSMVMESLAGLEKQNNLLNQIMSAILDQASQSEKTWNLQAASGQISYADVSDKKLVLQKKNQPMIDSLRRQIAANQLVQDNIRQRYKIR